MTGPQRASGSRSNTPRPGPGQPGRPGRPGRPGQTGRSQDARLKAAGPLGRVLATDGTQVHSGDYPLRAGANALILIRRVAFVDSHGVMDDKAQRPLLTWAQEHALGQDPQLLRQIAARRQQALHHALRRAAQPPAGPWKHQRFVVRPLWRLATGLGNRTNPYEIGLSLHGSYGWPLIPGSTLKGVTCAFAETTEQATAEPALLDEIFGLPRQSSDRDSDTSGPGTSCPGASGPTARRGTVTFLDALPLGGPVQVLRDVITPHVQPYYRDNAQPPAEHHNPIPVEFLVIGGGAFAVDLIGPARYVDQAAAWCRAAIDDLGVGAKTASGYGYLAAEGQAS
ncbi:MAG: type III-B CRISPR module RAMP protein Cmr6 [Micromonosporaceae bacterium]|nr:type III-B CRISPR module RAMP protein Cmr6 [Micromonosporaceae bacterium]